MADINIFLPLPISEQTKILVEIIENKLIKDEIKSEFGSYLDIFGCDIVILQFISLNKLGLSCAKHSLRFAG